MNKFFVSNLIVFLVVIFMIYGSFKIGLWEEARKIVFFDSMGIEDDSEITMEEIEENISLSQNSRAKTNVLLGGEEFVLDLSVTDIERQRGLSGRKGLDENTGMLFVFDIPNKWGIWMKGMLFSIDIIWIAENGEIVHIENNISPDTFPEVFRPKSDALWVIEIFEGEAERLGLKEGDIISI